MKLIKPVDPDIVLEFESTREYEHWVDETNYLRGGQPPTAAKVAPALPVPMGAIILENVSESEYGISPGDQDHRKRITFLLANRIFSVKIRETTVDQYRPSKSR